MFADESCRMPATVPSVAQSVFVTPSLDAVKSSCSPHGANIPVLKLPAVRNAIVPAEVQSERQSVVVPGPFERN